MIGIKDIGKIITELDKQCDIILFIPIYMNYFNYIPR